jgi:hypothetical protein
MVDYVGTIWIDLVSSPLIQFSRAETLELSHLNLNLDIHFLVSLSIFPYISSSKNANSKAG